MVRHGIELNSPAIRDFCLKWKITELSVFGSVLRDDFRADSDIDFLADYDDSAEWDLFDSLRMEDELAEIVCRPVDVVDRFALEDRGNRFIKKEIFSTAELIYAS